MNRLQRDFEARRQKTVKALKDAGRPPEDERLYHLRSKDQILNHAREMLVGAKTVVLLKLPTFAIHAIEGAIEKAADRGVGISILSPEAIAIEGAEVAVATETVPDEICIVVDGNQTLAGKVSQEGDSDALWTRFATLAAVHHAGLSAEISLAHVGALLAADEKRSRIQRAVDTRRALP